MAGVGAWWAWHYPTLEHAVEEKLAGWRVMGGDWYGRLLATNLGKAAEDMEKGEEKKSTEEAETARTEQLRANMLGWHLAVRQEQEEASWGFDLESDSYVQRGNDTHLTTVSPVALMLSQPVDFGFWENFRTAARMGVGVVHQFRETDDAVESEMRTLVRMGLGAEWTPTDWMLFRMGYEYSLLPVHSTLNPEMPTQDHTVSLGVEFKF